MQNESVDLAENLFRRHMAELGRKGGAVTARKAKSDPNFFPAIGRMGGRASVAARRAKFVREAALIESLPQASFELKPEPEEHDEVLLASTFSPPQAPVLNAPEPSAPLVRSITKADILADLDRMTERLTK